MSGRRDKRPTLCNPLTGKPQYDGAMWSHREIEAGIVEERVEMTVRRWKLGDNGVPLRQDVHSWTELTYGPWVEDHDPPMSVELFLSRFSRGERIDGGRDP